MLCKFVGCNKKHYGKGYCRAHYRRLEAYGSPESKYDLSGYSKLGGVKDDRPGARGSLAVNIINDIKVKARKRGKPWNLTHAEAFSLITQECAYCPFKPTWPDNRVGIDRVDNSRGYDLDNCAPCCFTCNSAKGDKTTAEFLAWLAKAYNKNFPPVPGKIKLDAA